MSLNIVITTLPSDGGSPITDVEYETNESGAWVSLGANLPGSYPTDAVRGDNVRIRAVNAVGPSAPSAVKRMDLLNVEVSIAGLAFYQGNPYARIGNELAMSAAVLLDGVATAPDQRIWSISNPNDPDKSEAPPTFGTGAAPTSLVSGAWGTLYLHVRIGTEWFTAHAPIQYAPGNLPALAGAVLTKDTGLQPIQHAAATGTGLTWNYVQTNAIPGVTYDAETRTHFVDTDLLPVQAGTAYGVAATDQAGRPAIGSPRTATFSIEAAAVATPPVLASVVVTQEAGGLGNATVTFDQNEPAGRPAWVRLHMRNPANPAPTPAEAWAGTGAVLTAALTGTVGQLNVAGVVTGLSNETLRATAVASYQNDGNALSNVVEDATADIFDTVPPTLLSSTPADDATGVAVGADFVAVFSETMDTGAGVATLREVATLTVIQTWDFGAGSPAGATWSTTTETDDTLTLNPTADLTQGVEYEVILTGFRDESEVPMETAPAISFTAAAAGGPTTLMSYDFSDADQYGDFVDEQGTVYTVDAAIGELRRSVTAPSSAQIRPAVQPAFGPNYWIEFVIGDTAGAGLQLQPYIRRNAAASQFGVTVTWSTNDISVSGASPFATITADNVAPFISTDNAERKLAVLRLEVVGDLLTIKINGVVPDPALEDIDISQFPDNRTTVLNLRGTIQYGIESWAAGNL